jgi:hypothetical protein
MAPSLVSLPSLSRLALIFRLFMKVNAWPGGSALHLWRCLLASAGVALRGGVCRTLYLTALFRHRACRYRGMVAAR